MATIIIRHKVGNFDTWLKGHQDRLNAFAPVVKSFQTFQDTNDPNSIALVMDVSDMNKLNEIANDPALQPLKDKHTVIEPIIISTEVAV